MKTLEKIQSEVLKETRFSMAIDYDDLEKLNTFYNEVAKRYAQSVAEDLRERIAEEAKVRTRVTPGGTYHEVDKDSIRNVEIITP